MELQFKELRKYQELSKEILSKCQTVDFGEGDVLLKEGGYAKFIPLVISGLVKVYKEDEKGNEVLLYYINAGESCIMSATYCMQDVKSEVKAVVVQSTKVILVPARTALEFSRKYVGWNEFLFNLFKTKYSDLLHIIQILTFEKKDKRLLDYLHKENQVKGSNIINITHQKIANDLGTTREVISRLLKKLESEGFLELKHKQVVLK